MAYFPMFINLEDATALVVGGGHVAVRKVAVLKEFCRTVRVVAPEVEKTIKSQQDVTVILRSFREEDLRDVDLVVVATDDRDRNTRIADLCKERHIPVNTVDDVENCTFIFPSYLKRGDVVAAVSSGGKSPLVTQYIRDQLSETLTEEVAELTDFLGEIRERVKRETERESQRKAIYRALFAWGLEHHRIPEESVCREIIERYQGDTRLY